MEDLNIPIFAQAKIEYTKQLIEILYPHMFDGIKSIYDESKIIYSSKTGTPIAAWVHEVGAHRRSGRSRHDHAGGGRQHSDIVFKPTRVRKTKVCALMAIINQTAAGVVFGAGTWVPVNVVLDRTNAADLAAHGKGQADARVRGKCRDGYHHKYGGSGTSNKRMPQISPWPFWLINQNLSSAFTFANNNWSLSKGILVW